MNSSRAILDIQDSGVMSEESIRFQSSVQNVCPQVR